MAQNGRIAFIQRPTTTSLLPYGPESPSPDTSAELLSCLRENDIDQIFCAGFDIDHFINHGALNFRQVMRGWICLSLWIWQRAFIQQFLRLLHLAHNLSGHFKEM